jgi:hypothetical protein
VFHTVCLEVPVDEDIPAYGNDYGLMAHINDENEDFYSDLALYLRDVTHLQAIGVTVANISRVTAQQVVIRMTFAQPQVEVSSSNGRAAKPGARTVLRALRQTYTACLVHKLTRIRISCWKPIPLNYSVVLRADYCVAHSHIGTESIANFCGIKVPELSHEPRQHSNQSSLGLAKWFSIWHLIVKCTLHYKTGRQNSWP